MDWQTSVADLSSVPEQYHALYSRDGDEGDFQLDSGISTLLADRGALNGTLRKVREERDAAKRSSAAFTALGFDAPEEIQAKIDELTEQLSGATPDAEKIRAEVGKSFEAKITAATTKNEALVVERDAAISELRNLTRNSAVQEAISGARGNAQLLGPLVNSRTQVIEEDGKRVVRVLDELGEIMHDSAGAPMTVKAFVERLRADEAFTGAFDPDPEKKGVGGNGRSGGKSLPGTNPWSKDQWNITEQMKLKKDNPDRARALQQQAGR